MNASPPTLRTRIKICGLTRAEDVIAAVIAGADAIGFVFYPLSPRHVSVEHSVKLMRLLPPFVSSVGLFVNADSAVVRDVLKRAQVSLLQFHGDEDESYCKQFGVPYIKALQMAPGVDLLKSAKNFPSACGFLLDSPSQGYGGSGKTFDWSLVPQDMQLPLILSGGLRPDNVARAVRQVRPWAVDVSSGVEAAKGIKDAQKISDFCAAVKEADA